MVANVLAEQVQTQDATNSCWHWQIMKDHGQEWEIRDASWNAKHWSWDIDVRHQMIVSWVNHAFGVHNRWYTDWAANKWFIIACFVINPPSENPCKEEHISQKKWWVGLSNLSTRVWLHHLCVVAGCSSLLLCWLWTGRHQSSYSHHRLLSPIYFFCRWLTNDNNNLGYWTHVGSQPSRTGWFPRNQLILSKANHKKSGTLKNYYLSLASNLQVNYWQVILTSHHYINP